MMPYICPPFEYLYSILTKSGLAHGGLFLRMWPLAFGIFYLHVAATTVERPMVRREVKDENVWGLKIAWCYC